MCRPSHTLAFALTAGLTAGLTGCTSEAPEAPKAQAAQQTQAEPPTQAAQQTQAARPEKVFPDVTASSKMNMDQAQVLYKACVDWVVDGKPISEAWLRANGFVPHMGEWRRTSLKTNPLKGPGIFTALSFDQSGCNISHVQEAGNASYIGTFIGEMLVKRGFAPAGDAFLGVFYTRGEIKLKLTGVTGQAGTGITLARAK